MRFLDRIFNRNSVQPAHNSTITDIENAVNWYLSGSPSSLKWVTEEGALSLSAVYACVRLLSDTVAIMPIHLYRRMDQGRSLVKGHPSSRVFRAPSSYTVQFDILSHLMVSVTRWGNGYLRIHRDRSFRPVGLEMLMPYDVTPCKTSDDRVVYRISGVSKALESYDIVHLKGLGTDGIVGKSPIALHRENLGLSLEVQSYGERFFSKGGNTSSVLEYPGALKKEQLENLRTQFAEIFQGLENAHKPMILEGGMKYNRINIPLEDAQFIATRKYQKNEIATIFGVPPHMIADLERATNNNIEHQGMEFVMYSLMPYLVKIESEVNRKLLFEDEQDELYFKFNVNSLMRGDTKTRSEYYRNMFHIGAMSPNEIRELEEMNPYKGGSVRYVPVNLAAAGSKNNAKNSPDVQQAD